MLQTKKAKCKYSHTRNRNATSRVEISFNYNAKYYTLDPSISSFHSARSPTLSVFPVPVYRHHVTLRSRATRVNLACTPGVCLLWMIVDVVPVITVNCAVSTYACTSVGFIQIIPVISVTVALRFNVLGWVTCFKYNLVIIMSPPQRNAPNRQLGWLLRIYTTQFRYWVSVYSVLYLQYMVYFN